MMSTYAQGFGVLVAGAFPGLSDVESMARRTVSRAEPIATQAVQSAKTTAQESLDSSLDKLVDKAKRAIEPTLDRLARDAKKDAKPWLVGGAVALTTGFVGLAWLVTKRCS